MKYDKLKKRLNQIIENIEQLGADTRYYNDYNNYDEVLIELYSIREWVKKGISTTKSLKNERGELNGSINS